jgi:hypothetical protein
MMRRWKDAALLTSETPHLPEAVHLLYSYHQTTSFRPAPE